MPPRHVSHVSIHLRVRPYPERQEHCGSIVFAGAAGLAVCDGCSDAGQPDGAHRVGLCAGLHDNWILEFLLLPEAQNVETGRP